MAPECAVYLCVCVCEISNQSTSKKPHYVSDLSKLDALLHKRTLRSGTKIARLNIGRSIILSSKTAHQMWHDHLSAKETRQQKEQWGWGLEATGKGKGLDKI